MTPALNFLYLHSERIGYGVHGIATHKALSDVGVDVYDGLPGSGDLDLSGKREGVCKDILFLTIPTHVPGWLEGQRRHLFTMWEATQLPEAMREHLHNFETILTPSQNCVELFSQYHDNVHLVPLGVDADRWHYQPRRDDIFFNFLIAGSGMRKGTDLAHRAFTELFADYKPSWGPIPKLIMKNPKSENYGGEGVEVVGGYLPAEDEVALYASAHCYLQPSRGEGWGMQPLQAMSQGCPTILTDAHGHGPFAEYGIPISATTVPAKYMSIFGNSGDWWEPDYEEFRDAMWNVYSNYGFYKDAAERMAPFVQETFTWERSAQRIVDIIGKERLCERFEGEVPSVWVEPKAKLFRTVVNRDWKADIAGVTHLLVKGREYWKPADVKRILFEAGLLDPICLGNEDGLTPEQLEQRDIYVADHSRCPTCGQLPPIYNEAEVG